MANQRVAIIGAGPAGSAAANALLKKGFEVVLFEKSSYIGGRSYSHRDQGFVLDTGAGFVTNFYHRLFKLAKQGGFSTLFQPISRVTGLVKEGELATLGIGSASSFFRFPWVSFTEKLKMVGWGAAITKRRRHLDIAAADTLSKYDKGSIAGYIKKKLGDNVYHYFIRPGIEPFWYFSCDEASEALIRGLTAHAAGASFYALPEGIDQICSELVKGAELRTGCAVSHLSVEGDRVSVGYQRTSSEASEVSQIQSEESERFDHIVVATTASVASGLSKHLPSLWFTEEQRRFLEEQRYASNIHAAFRVDQRVEKSDMSSVFPCGPGEHPVAAVSFVSAKQVGTRQRRAPKGEEGGQEGGELISVYLSHKESEKRLNETEASIYAFCWAHARALYPALPETYTPFHLSRRAEAIPIPKPGHYRAADAFVKAQAHSSAPVRFCGDYLSTATLEGAIASGLKAAQEIIRL